MNMNINFTKTIVIFSLLISNIVSAKTTYIPHYNSYIHIESADGESLTEQSLRFSTSLSDANQSFRLSVIHEEMTDEKVKSIKRSKTTAGWMAASAMLSSVAAMTNGNRDIFQSRLAAANADFCWELADMYAKNAVAEQTLKIEVLFENLSNREMMLNDTERGLVWFVRPGDNFVIELHNPDALLLRISDAKDVTSNVYYASVAGGNSVEKVDVTYETDAYILSVQKGSSDPMYNMNSPETDIYWYIDKEEFISRRIDEEEFKRLRGNNK